MTVCHHALMMEAASASETSVKFYQTTRHNNIEDSYLRTHCRENLKSHQVLSIFYEYLYVYEHRKTNLRQNCIL
jgi:hypothetical protein